MSEQVLRPERYSKIARLFDEWMCKVMILSFSNGMVLKGSSYGSTDNYIFEPDDEDAFRNENCYRAASLCRIEIIQFPENPKKFVRNDGVRFIWVGSKEDKQLEEEKGGALEFDNLYEPDSITLEDGREIWNLKENWCLRRPVHGDVEPFKEKIR